MVNKGRVWIDKMFHICMISNKKLDPRAALRLGVCNRFQAPVCGRCDESGGVGDGCSSLAQRVALEHNRRRRGGVAVTLTTRADDKAYGLKFLAAFCGPAKGQPVPN
jgi:hypothetical protein